MSLAVVHSRAEIGVDAPAVEVEVHLAGGLPAFSIVGLPEAAVRESRERVRGALLHARFEFPARRITVNLAPADLPKEGGRYDLPIAVGVLAASGQLGTGRLAGTELIGELALGGAVRGVRGALSAVLAARAAGRGLIVPAGNRTEAALVSGADVRVASHLLEVAGHFSGRAELPCVDAGPPAWCDGGYPDLADVRGQQRARRALEIAAAGGHSILFVGPPGSGKTMLAMRLPGLLPALTADEAIESAAVRSLVDGGTVDHWGRRPFRSPHHNASAVALVGGGSHPRPGEISLAHHGVLFLDELPEFDRRVLESLREPLESGQVTIARAARSVRFPARFQLVAAMNPCPCGWLGDPGGRCRCSLEQVRRYQGRISGPVLDRIDLHVPVPRVATGRLAAAIGGEGSAAVAARVREARRVQTARSGAVNARLEGKSLEEACAADAEARTLLARASERLGLSARGYHRLLRVARTIADLAGTTGVRAVDVAEAVAYRARDAGDG